MGLVALKKKLMSSLTLRNCYFITTSGLILRFSRTQLSWLIEAKRSVNINIFMWSQFFIFFICVSALFCFYYKVNYFHDREHNRDRTSKGDWVTRKDRCLIVSGKTSFLPPSPTPLPPSWYVIARCVCLVCYLTQLSSELIRNVDQPLYDTNFYNNFRLTPTVNGLFSTIFILFLVQT